MKDPVSAVSYLSTPIANSVLLFTEGVATFIDWKSCICLLQIKLLYLKFYRNLERAITLVLHVKFCKIILSTITWHSLISTVSCILPTIKLMP